MNQKTDVRSAEFMQSMAGLMSQALESPEGLRALAAALAIPIEEEIKTLEIAPLLLTRHNLPPTDRPLYRKRAKMKAYWISGNGQAVETPVDRQEEIEIPIHRIHSTPMIDVSLLKSGNVDNLADVQKASADEIRKAIDKRVITVISAAVPSENIVEQTGDTLEESTLNQAISILEDKELSVKTILLRGQRFGNMKGWSLDPQTKNELRVKGFIKTYGGADILKSSSMFADEVILLPEEEVGKMPVRTKLTVEAVNQPLRFKTGWLVWTEVGMGVLRPDLLVKIKILGS